MLTLVGLRTISTVIVGLPVDFTGCERLLLGFIAACWISRDAQADRYEWPQDYTLIFYPIVLPAYLIHTRKWRGAAWLVVVVAAYGFTFLLPAVFIEQ